MINYCFKVEQKKREENDVYKVLWTMVGVDNRVIFLWVSWRIVWYNRQIFDKVKNEILQKK